MDKNCNRSDGFETEGDLNLSSAREQWNRSHITGETALWLKRDSDVFLHQSLSTPCLNVLDGCQGAEITDLQGRSLLDFHGNNVHQVGFSHPKVVAAITEQMQKLSFCTRRYTNKLAVQLAEKLVSLAPGDLTRVLFAPGGTGAIGMALKLARAATGRHKTISMWDSFHGASLDAISIGGEAIFRQGAGPLLPGCEHVPPPDPVQCPFKCGHTCNLNCADYIEYVLEKEGDVAAVIGETVRSIPYIPPPDYWKKIRAACDRHGALLILDEIPHCLGRTGRWFTCQHYDVVPDILVLGKGLGGGIFPLAAILAREGLNIAGSAALGHYTHEKSPVACAAALAMLEVIEEEKLLERATELGDLARDFWTSQIAPTQSLETEFRGLGLLMGIGLRKWGGGPAVKEAEKVMYAALARGLNFKITKGNVLTLTPALTIRREELLRAMDILSDCLKDAGVIKTG